jgi:glutamate/tyrosine decarboxylase-like PLP-dependent enzyme
MTAEPIAALRQACAQPLPHPDLDELSAISEQVRGFLLHDFVNLPDQLVGQFARPGDLDPQLCEPAPEAGLGFPAAFQEFQETIAPWALRPGHPRFLAFIPGAPTFVSILGDWLCAGLNYFAGVWMEAAGPTQVELQVLSWFRDLLGMPATTRGILTGGGSEANLTALVVARGRLRIEDRPRAVLYLSSQRHWSVDRAAMVMGLLPDQLRPVPVGADQRLIPGALRQTIVDDRRLGKIPWALVANAGATNTGAVDPLADLGVVCREENLWFHVDAAYGWPAVLTPTGQTLLAGIDQADSVTLDPHKWFAQPFEAGGLLVRDGLALERTYHLRPEYMQDVRPQEGEINFADHGIALTRRFRALKIWLSVKVLGLSWFRALVERCCQLAELAQRLLEELGAWEILCPRSLGILCFRRRAPAMSEDQVNAVNRSLMVNLNRRRQFFLSSTDLGGRFALRLCFVNWRTTAADVENLVRALEELAQG